MKHVHEKLAPDASKVASAAKLAAEKIRAALAEVPGLVTLTTPERKRVAKMRTGGERHVRGMAQLAREQARLVPAGVDPAAMTTAIDTADALASLHAVLAHALQSIDDTMLLATGTAWHDALDIYAAAESAARRDDELKARLAPMEQFLRLGPRHAHADPARTQTE